jgi:hypothetical protein
MSCCCSLGAEQPDRRTSQVGNTELNRSREGSAARLTGARLNSTVRGSARSGHVDVREAQFEHQPSGRPRAVSRKQGVEVSAIELIKPVFDLMKCTLPVIHERTDPAHRQAQRLLDAAAAHGVSPIQLPRLMPEHLRLQPAQTSRASSLSKHLKVETIDWFAKTFAIRQEWLDGESVSPHFCRPWYKEPERFRQWLLEHGSGCAHELATLHVLMEKPHKDPSCADGRFLLVFEEPIVNLPEDMSVSRYWLVSNGLSFRYRDCVLDLLSGMTIAEHLLVRCTGRVVSQRVLAHAENASLKQFLPQVIKQSRPHPIHDWVPRMYLHANCLSQAHATLWEATLKKLSDAKTPLASLRGSIAA